MLTTLALTAGAAETPVETPALEGVGFWRRALARMLDQGVHFMVGYGVGLLVGALVMIARSDAVSAAHWRSARSSRPLSVVAIPPP